MSRSSTEAEYQAMATTTLKVIWIQQLLIDLHIDCSHVLVLHCDNISVMALATNLVLHSKAKHIEIDCHFVLERVQQGTIIMQFVTSVDQHPDMFTKGLCFTCNCSNLMLGTLPHELEGG